VWALPPFKNNPTTLLNILTRLDVIRQWIAEGAGFAPQRAESTDIDIRDVFISHASEDKDEIARPLAKALQSEGVTCWFDEFELKLGDNLRRKIEEGLRMSRHGITILSKAFFAKPWPQRELDALFLLENDNRRIMPIWHGLDAEEIKSFAPLLADKYAVKSSIGIATIVAEIKRALS
jgi:hypothetical protein